MYQNICYKVIVIVIVMAKISVTVYAITVHITETVILTISGYWISTVTVIVFFLNSSFFFVFFWNDSLLIKIWIHCTYTFLVISVMEIFDGSSSLCTIKELGKYSQAKIEAKQRPKKSIAYFCVKGCNLITSGNQIILAHKFS